MSIFCIDDAFQLTSQLLPRIAFCRRVRARRARVQMDAQVAIYAMLAMNISGLQFYVRVLWF